MTNLFRWSARVLEGGTIVLSILAAFALDSWWDNRQAGIARYEGMGAVAEELAAAREHVAERLTAYDQIEQYLISVLHLMNAAGYGSTVEVPDTLMAAVLYARN